MLGIHAGSGRDKPLLLLVGDCRLGDAGSARSRRCCEEVEKGSVSRARPRESDYGWPAAASRVTLTVGPLTDTDAYDGAPQ